MAGLNPNDASYNPYEEMPGYQPYRGPLRTGPYQAATTIDQQVAPSSAAQNATQGLDFGSAYKGMPQSGLGSSVGTGLGFLAGGPVGSVVGNVAGTAVDSLISWVSNSYAEKEYKKTQEANRKFAQKLYDDQLAREEEQKQYQRGVYTKEWKYKTKLDKQTYDWQVNQETYKRHLDQVSAFTNFLNSDVGMRNNLITNWQNMRRAA